MLSKNDFWTRREKEHSKTSPCRKILIQASSISDSVIARFRESNVHWLTFSTASAHVCGLAQCNKVVSNPRYTGHQINVFVTAAAMLGQWQRNDPIELQRCSPIRQNLFCNGPRFVNPFLSSLLPFFPSSFLPSLTRHPFVGVALRSGVGASAAP
jgi:hypothetical protein